ncbi:hypothetical protein CDAR_436121 [Caerostris darwini]|uniref:Uncharacterized protein n=1 Tax=Caerostris darwini TaxID=1538125 RepID=A0AAV4P7G6_9ARAC|nr:hypothetical protein CDAR_436121 [Caerostris darwini]
MSTNAVEHLNSISSKTNYSNNKHLDVQLLVRLLTYHNPCVCRYRISAYLLTRTGISRKIFNPISRINASDHPRKAADNQFLRGDGPKVEGGRGSSGQTKVARRQN